MSAGMSPDETDGEFLSLTLPEVKVYLPRGEERRTTWTAVERERRQEIRRIQDREYDQWKARQYTITSLGTSQGIPDTDTPFTQCENSTP